MVIYWLSTLIKAFWDSVTFIGQTKSGIAYTVLAFVIGALWLLKKHGGWREAMKQWLHTAGEGVVIAAIAFALVLLGHVIYEPFLLDRDMQSRWSQALADKTQSDALRLQCSSQLSTQTLRGDLYQNSFTSQQGQLNSQQGTINSCVVSLGKMNPVVRREIRVIIIPYGIMDAKTNRFVSRFATNKVYTSVAVITTNEDELRPSGYLRCDKPFDIIGAPQLPFIAQTAMVGNSMPTRISDHEYQIIVTNTGSYWGPSSPIYMPVSSESENLTGCVFTPQ